MVSLSFLPFCVFSFSFHHQPPAVFDLAVERTLYLSSYLPIYLSLPPNLSTNLLVSRSAFLPFYLPPRLSIYSLFVSLCSYLSALDLSISR